MNLWGGIGGGALAPPWPLPGAVQGRVWAGQGPLKGLTWQATWLELEVHRLVVVVWSGGAVRYPYVRNVPSIRVPQ